MPFIIAIDGPAGSGKGTLAKGVAKRLNITNIDTGAMFRCVTLEMLRKNIGLEDLQKIEEMLKNINIEFKEEKEGTQVILNEENVTLLIRTEDINKIISDVSKISIIREKMLAMQREYACKKDVVMEGRDIGTVVFPNANIKIFLDASPEERAKRRVEQNEEKGLKSDYNEILESIKNRDNIDKNRKIAPLKQAEDAIYIDSTNMSVREVEDEVVRLAEEKRKLEKKDKMDKKTVKEKKKKDSIWKIIQREFVRYFLIGLYKIVYRVQVKGKENVPKEGAFILCGNHVDFILVPVIVLFTPRKDINFIAKSELFNNKMLAWLGYLFDVIPVKRGKQDVDSMKKSLKTLSSGHVLGLFPEGTRNGLQKKVKVKNGASFMALKTGSEIVPVGIKVKKQGLFSKVILNYGKPLDYSEKKSKMPEKEVLEETTTEMMDVIVKLIEEA